MYDLADDRGSGNPRRQKNHAKTKSLAPDVFPCDRLMRQAPTAFNPLSTCPFLHKNLAVSFLFPLARGENHCESYDGANRAIKAGPPAMDYAEHEKLTVCFSRAIKYTMAGAALILALLACFRG
jgi:hypothetical protein